MPEVIAHVTVDAERCQGHARCYGLAPELFAADDLGFASAIGDGAVLADQLAAAELAVKNCPEYAVTLEMIEK